MSSSHEAGRLANQLDNMDHMRPPIQNSRDADVARSRPADRLYPAKFDFDPNDKADRMRQLKMTLPEAQFGQKFLEKEDLEYVDKKAQEIELEKFDRWYGTIFNHNDPAQLQLSKQIYPEWFERRLKAIDETVEFQKRIAKMNMLGIQSKEDVLTAYAVASGRIDPQVYNVNVMNPVDMGNDIVFRQYRFGFFSPYSYNLKAGPTTQPISAATPLTGRADAQGQPANNVVSRAAAMGIQTPLQLGQLMAGNPQQPAMGLRHLGFLNYQQ